MIVWENCIIKMRFNGEKKFITAFYIYIDSSHKMLHFNFWKKKRISIILCSLHFAICSLMNSKNRIDWSLRVYCSACKNWRDKCFWGKMSVRRYKFWRNTLAFYIEWKFIKNTIKIVIFLATFQLEAEQRFEMCTQIPAYCCYNLM